MGEEKGADLSPAPLPRTRPTTISTSPTKLPRSAPLPPAAPERRQKTFSEGEGIIGDYLEKIRQLENISDDMTLLGSLMSQRL